MTTAVVLGEHGFLGSHVVQALHSLGVATVAVGSSDCDLTMGASVGLLSELAPHPDIVIHSAGRVPVKTPRQMLDNIEMVNNVIAYVQTVGAHLVLISTDGVYGKHAGPTSETTPTCPDTLHGVAALAKELVASSCLSENGLAVVRPVALFGLGNQHQIYGPNRFTREALKSGRITLVGDGTGIRDHLWVADAGRMVAELALTRHQGIINLCSGQAVSFMEIALAIRAVIKNVEIICEGEDVGSPGRVYDTTSLRSLATFPQATSLTRIQEMVREQVLIESGEGSAANARPLLEERRSKAETFFEEFEE